MPSILLKVVYNITNFLEKNRDHLSANLFEVMRNSESQFVSDLFQSHVSATGALENK
jgi:myosin heavy subunit